MFGLSQACRCTHNRPTWTEHTWTFRICFLLIRKAITRLDRPKFKFKPYYSLDPSFDGLIWIGFLITLDWSWEWNFATWLNWAGWRAKLETAVSNRPVCTRLWRKGSLSNLAITCWSARVTYASIPPVSLVSTKTIRLFKGSGCMPTHAGLPQPKSIS